jgi:hypothetical protein
MGTLARSLVGSKVGLQAAQARLDGGADVGGVQVLAARADPGLVRVRAGRLGRQHDPVAPARLLEPRADEAFGRPLRGRGRRHRIHFRRVDEIDAAVERIVDLAVGVGFGVLLAERHGAEADAGDEEVGGAEAVHLHGYLS